MPECGARINLNSSLGTIRYIGEIINSKGTWLGIEWDDSERGKHDGSKEGIRYFTCRHPKSGSFIRPAASISFGRSFLDALISKYVELPRQRVNTVEKVLLGSSNGAIEVEIVGLDKVRNKLSHIENLRHVSLDFENVAFAEDVGEIRTRCPNVRTLDLSRSLIPSWNVVLEIIEQLPLLHTLGLSHNRLQLPTLQPMPNPLVKLRELRLNNTVMSWGTMLGLSPLFPSLTHLEFGYNLLDSLSKSNDSAFPRLEHLNFDTNFLHDWGNIIESIIPLSHLQRLIVTSNAFNDIPSPRDTGKTMKQVKSVYIGSNQIASWSDVDALGQWFPHMESLILFENPIMKETTTEAYARQLTIARIASLTSFNGVAVSREERKDCELFYLSFITKHIASEETRSKTHPRWLELCQKYGRPEEFRAKISHDTMSSKLTEISLNILTREPVWPSSSSTELDPTPLKLQVLPNMQVKALKLKALKAIKRLSLQHKKIVKVYIWVEKEGSGAWEEMEEDTGTSKDVGWWGIESGSRVGLWIEE